MYKLNFKTDSRYGDKKLKINNGSKEYILLSERDLNDMKENVNNSTYLSDDKNSTNIGYLNFSKKIKENELNKIEAFDLSLDRDKCLFRPIIDLPNEMFNLNHLKRLHLDGNKIKNLPDSIGENLINLEILTISNNKLDSLPKQLKNLTKLVSIHLSNNKFTQFPNVLSDIKSLVFLDLSSNQIDCIPHEIGFLENLESLLLNNNNIKELPSTIGKLLNLKTFWLGNNKLEKLPKEICELKKLEWNFNKFDFNFSTILSNNLLTVPTYETCEMGLEEINNFFSNSNAKNNYV